MSRIELKECQLLKVYHVPLGNIHSLSAKLPSKYISNHVKLLTYQKSILEVLQDRNHHKGRESLPIFWP